MTSYRSHESEYPMDRHARHTCPVQKAAAAVGAAFLLVGVLGFVPGITSHFGDMEFAGHESGAKLLGLFQVSILHNLVHVLFGIIGLAAARTAGSARSYLIGGGVVYLALFLYGLAVGQEDDANFVPLNGHDDWLHLVLGAAMILLGLALWKHRDISETDDRLDLR